MHVPTNLIRAFCWQKIVGTAFVLVFCLLCANGGVAGTHGEKSTILGNWRGISLCAKIPGNEGCHDEVVYYEIRDTHTAGDTVSLKASEVTDHESREMYTIALGFDTTRHRWQCEFRNGRVHILWSYAVDGKMIEGTCVDLPSMAVRRNVVVRKEE